MRAWMRKPSRVQVALHSRKARKSEAYILGAGFPELLEGRVRKELPQVSERGWELIEQGLREWFVCCAWRGNRILGMPSRAVDEAWHEFILVTPSYVSFCQRAFGQYLHHTPDEALSAPMPDALAETVRAWDRSDSGHESESVLWDLDRKLGIEEPFAGISPSEMELARTRSPYPLATGWVGVPTYAYVGANGGGGCFTGGGGEGGGGGGGCGSAGG
jgi:uncharacterized membrane protein YgcG